MDSHAPPTHSLTFSHYFDTTPAAAIFSVSPNVFDPFFIGSWSWYYRCVFCDRTTKTCLSALQFFGFRVVLPLNSLKVSRSTLSKSHQKRRQHRSHILMKTAMTDISTLFKIATVKEKRIRKCSFR